MFDPELKHQWSERFVDSEQNFQIRYWRMFIDYETHQLQSNYVAYICFNAEIGLFILLSISQHNTVWWSDRSIHRPFHQSTQYHVVVRSKACETVTMGGGVHDLSAEFSIVSFHLALVDTSTFWSSGQTCF